MTQFTYSRVPDDIEIYVYSEPADESLITVKAIRFIARLLGYQCQLSRYFEICYDPELGGFPSYVSNDIKVQPIKNSDYKKLFGDGTKEDLAEIRSAIESLDARLDAIKQRQLRPPNN